VLDVFIISAICDMFGKSKEIQYFWMDLLAFEIDGLYLCFLRLLI
jgi:hypothetical protein